jgi:3-oxoadipate enol-lactonase
MSPGPLRRVVELSDATLECHFRAAAGDRELPPLILLHPWFGCWKFWDRTVAALPEFATYAVDLYSLGAGEGWREYASPEGIARALATMLDQLSVTRCHVVGNSMGSIAAQALAAAEPRRVEKLVLVGTGTRATGLKPDYRKAVDSWIAGEADRNAFGLDLRPRLPTIAAKTLVIRGELDGARTRAHVDELLAGIPNSRQVEIPGAGHSPQVDSPEAFTALVREFLLAT